MPLADKFKVTNMWNWTYNESYFQKAVCMMISSNPDLPCPSEFGWENEHNVWVPQWISIPALGKKSRALVKCTCKGDCSNCSCGQADVDCDLLCKCPCPKLNLFNRS